MPESNHEEWKELRARVDSIANAVFLIAGGSLSLSITVTLDLKSKSLLEAEVAAIIQDAWMFLLASVLLMLLNKVFTVLQAFLLHEYPAYHGRVYKKYNLTGWALGTIGLTTFALGLILMVQAASLALQS